MSNPRPLTDISAALLKEIREIEVSFLGGKGAVCVIAHPASYDPHGDGCVVSLWDAWNRFVRRLVLTNSAGSCIGISGITYTPTVSRNPAQTLQTIIGSPIKTSYGEPNWQHVPTISAVSSLLGLQNSSNIIGAIASSTITTIPGATMANPLEEIRVIRNYIAHKSQRNLQLARSYMTNPVSDVNGHLWQKTTGGIERFTAWTDGVAAIAEAACG
jgi:hypothetical protein